MDLDKILEAFESELRLNVASRRDAESSCMRVSWLGAGGQSFFPDAASAVRPL